MVTVRIGENLNVHRTTVPIDHPDRSVTRVKLEYPTVDVNIIYLIAIGKGTYFRTNVDWSGHGTLNSFVDRAIEGFIFDANAPVNGSFQRIFGGNAYLTTVNSSYSTQDLLQYKLSGSSAVVIGYEAVDLTPNRSHHVKTSWTGSTCRVYREDMSTARFSAVDSSIVVGRWGMGSAWNRGNALADGWLRAPSSTLRPVKAVAEFNVEGSGEFGDPYRPAVSRNLVPVQRLSGLPDFLYREAKKYEVLRSKGFTDDEMQMLLGYIPQHEVDVNAVSLGVFEFYPDKSHTVIAALVDSNPFSSDAVEKQKDAAVRWWRSPRDYGEAVELYNMLKKDYQYWIAGKDDFAYQMLGWEVLEWMGNVDFYYGELVEHRTHYDQLRQVDDEEIRRRLNELIVNLSSGSGLDDERQKHVWKAREVLKRGW